MSGERFISEFKPAKSDVVICGSMSHKEGWLRVADELRVNGYVVETPDINEHLDWSNASDEYVADLKGLYVRQHIAKIAASGSILVYNDTKDGIEDYIGGNTFMEMAIAFAYDKQIYIYNDVPIMSYRDEIIALNPVSLNQDSTIPF